MARKTKANNSPRITNRRARHEYAITEKLEVGIALLGSEVKSVRNGQVSLAEGFARVEPQNMQLYLHDVDIAPYAQAGPAQHDPKRIRVLLAHKREIQKLLDETSAKGVTLVPLAMYFVRGRAKLEIGIGRGKAAHDKRQAMKTREADREIRKAMTRKRL